MNGRLLMIALLAFTAVFAVALVWFQFFAFYERTTLDSLTVNGQPVPVAGYEGLDASTSPLKRRGCFTADPAAFAGAAPAPDATPLLAPFWFGCFDAAAISRALEAGDATAYRLAADDPDGFDLMVAIYPDGRGYLWRQLNERYR